MTFKEAVWATASIRNHYKKGLQALGGGHADLVKCPNTRRLTGSVNLDAALAAAAPDAHRWDYAIGLLRSNSESAIWVEVHPASSTSVSDMLDKLRWLQMWLNRDAPEMKRLTQGKYYWVATDGRIVITPGSQQAKRLAAAGIRGPCRQLKLD